MARAQSKTRVIAFRVPVEKAERLDAIARELSAVSAGRLSAAVVERFIQEHDEKETR